MKKIICALAAAGMLIMSSQSAMAVSKGTITYGDPTGHGVYMGEGMYLQKDAVSEDGYAPGNDTVFDAVAFSNVKTVAIAPISYTPNKNEPTVKDTMAILDAAAVDTLSKNAEIKIVTYEEVADKILRETGEDITSMNRRKAMQVYRKYVSRYADAYAEVTISNGSKNMLFFLDVKKADDSKALYNYKESIASYNERQASVYAGACRNMVKAVEQGYKKAIKEANNKKLGIEWNLN